MHKLRVKWSVQLRLEEFLPRLLNYPKWRFTFYSIFSQSISWYSIFSADSFCRHFTSIIWVGFRKLLETETKKLLILLYSVMHGKPSTQELCLQWVLIIIKKLLRHVNLIFKGYIFFYICNFSGRNPRTEWFHPHIWNGTAAEWLYCKTKWFQKKYNKIKKKKLYLHLSSKYWKYLSSTSMHLYWNFRDCSRLFWGISGVLLHVTICLSLVFFLILHQIPPEKYH